MTEFASCWGLLVGSMLVASPVIFFKVKDSTAVEDDLRFSDETAAEVLGHSNETTDMEMDKPHAEMHTPTDTLRPSHEETIAKE
jgi:hypothetical protein